MFFFRHFPPLKSLIVSRSSASAVRNHTTPIPTTMFHNNSSSALNNATDSLDIYTDSGTEGGIVSDALYSYFEFYIYNFIIPITSIIGLVGNVLASIIMVKTASQYRQSIYIYMSSLTITDSLYLAVMILRCFFHIWKNFDAAKASEIEATLLAPIIFMDLSLSSISVLIIIVMSIERRYAIVKPLTVRETWVARYPVQIIIAIVIIVIVSVIPLPLCIGVVTDVNADNVTVYSAGIKSEMVEFFDLYVLIETILLSYIPFFLLIPLNVAIVVGFRSVVRKRREELPGNAVIPTQQLRVVITVSVIMIMYILFTAPLISVQTLSAIEPKFSLAGEESNTFWLFQDIGNTFVTINAATRLRGLYSNIGHLQEEVRSDVL